MNLKSKGKQKNIYYLNDLKDIFCHCSNHLDVINYWQLEKLLNLNKLKMAYSPNAFTRD